MSTSDKYINQSVVNAFKILDCFDEENDRLSSQEISRLLDLNASLVWRLLYTLDHLHYIKKTAEDKYQLSYKGLDFAKTFLNGLNLRRAAYPYTKALTNKVNLNVNLTILENNAAILISRIPKPNFPDSYFHLGRQFPLYCSSSGKVLLAYQSPEKQDRMIETMAMKKLTKNTIIDKEELKKELQKIRRQGFALDQEEYILGTHCIAVPVNGKSGEIAASISISNRGINESRKIDLLQYLNDISETAEKISYSLGFSLYEPE